MQRKINKSRVIILNVPEELKNCPMSQFAYYDFSGLKGKIKVFAGYHIPTKSYMIYLDSKRIFRLSGFMLKDLKFIN